jgi:uncharacterized protein
MMLNPLDHHDFLILPCRDNAGPDHWQSHWQSSLPNTRRVEQDEWVNPTYASWSARLDEYVLRAAQPVILIAHSLGTSLIMRWAHPGNAAKVAGAFMVAPSDRGPADIWPDAGRSGFSPMVLDPLPFPSLVAASRNDPYVAFDRAALFARSWGSTLTDMGDAGHMGNSGELGPWPEGLLLLGAFVSSLDPTSPSGPMTKS